eukprot:405213-Pyramimonas_sp.AAC.1
MSASTSAPLIRGKMSGPPSPPPTSWNSSALPHHHDIARRRSAISGASTSRDVSSRCRSPTRTIINCATFSVRQR